MSWLQETSERAKRNLQAIRPGLRSPATRLLIGPDTVPCESCKGRGSILQYRDDDPFAPESDSPNGQNPARVWPKNAR